MILKRGIIKGWIDYLASRRFAIYLLVITTVIISASNLLPNFAILDNNEILKLRNESPYLYWLSENLGVSRITKSPFFQIIPILIFISITACTIKRVKGEVQGKGSPAISGSLKSRYRLKLKGGRFDRRELKSILKGKGWTLSPAEDEDALLTGIKGENGFWGSILFHVGMLVVLAGIVISIKFGIERSLILTEGYSISLDENIEGLSNRGIEDIPLQKIRLTSFDTLVSEKDIDVKIDSNLLATDRFGIESEYKMEINRPLKLEGYKFIFIQGGYSPRFILKDKEGEVILDAVINMHISFPGVVDSFVVIDESLSFHVELFPDYYEENGIHKNRGRAAKNPVLFVRVEKYGEKIRSGFLPKKKVVSFDGYTLEFSELRHWIKIVISKDVGVIIITSGFFLIVTGLCVRFVLNKRSVWFIIEACSDGETATIGGRSMYFPDIFENELHDIAELISERTAGVMEVAAEAAPSPEI